MGLGLAIAESTWIFKEFFRDASLASLMLYHLNRGALTMKFNRSLMTGLVGLALIAVPITAAAKDNDRGGNDSHQAQAQSHSNDSHADAHHAEQANHNNGGGGGGQHEAREQHQAREGGGGGGGQHEARVENRNPAPENMNREASRGHNEARVENRNPAPENMNRDVFRGHNEARDKGRNYSAPAVASRESRDDRNESGRENGDRGRNYGERDRNYNDRDWERGDRAYRNYGRDYDHDDYDHDRDYAEGGWVMPYSYSGGACAWARHLHNVYRRDMYTGHPAAASYLIPQLRRAERSCGVGFYGYNDYRSWY
jgi:hypothetical protein